MIYRKAIKEKKRTTSIGNTSQHPSALGALGCPLDLWPSLASKQLDLSHRRTARASLISHARRLTFAPRTPPSPKTTVAYVCPSAGWLRGHVSGKGANVECRRRRRPGLLRPRPPLNLNALRVNLMSLDIEDRIY